jgi:hypothetical protein
MPRLSETMKDVVSCEKSGGGANDRYIPECPNGATHLVEDQVPAREVTRGTETSKYPEEEKII